MTWVVSILLLISVFAYVFYPERTVTPQASKPLLELLRERRENLYDNLRDLNFEFRAGKYQEEDYVVQRAALESEAAVVVAEIGQLESRASI